MLAELAEPPDRRSTSSSPRSSERNEDNRTSRATRNPAASLSNFCVELDDAKRYNHEVEPRHPDLARFAGRYVALDLATDEVLADAATLLDLVQIVRDRDLHASIVRAPRDDEPVLVGLG